MPIHKLEPQVLRLTDNLILSYQPHLDPLPVIKPTHLLPQQVQCSLTPSFLSSFACAIWRAFSLGYLVNPYSYIKVFFRCRLLYKTFPAFPGEASQLYLFLL